MATRKPQGLFAELKSEVKVPEPLFVTEDISIPPVTTESVKLYENAKTTQARMEAIYGDQLAAVEALFATEPIQMWQAFHKRVLAHMFGPGADEVEGK